MDLQFSAEDRAFAAEVREWLTSRLEGDFAEVRGQGAPGREYQAVDARIAWEQELGRAGFIGMSWPAAVGGLDLPLSRQLIFWDEYVRTGGPGRIGVVGDWLLGPTLIAHGSTEQQRRFLPGILDGTVRWCQGYSEPGAGSDLASLHTRAELDGDQWVISGHKIWTSVAHLAHWNFVLCRTGAPDSRHRGISYLLVPMDQPGVEVRPIRDLTGGDTDFCEVFYDGARTDAGNVVGEVDAGWRVAMSTVTFERGLSTVGYQLSFEEELRAITELARVNGRGDDPVVRQHLAAAWSNARILRWNLLRTMSSLQLGTTAPVTNVYKLFWASFHQELGELALEVMGADAMLARPGTHPFDALQTMFMYSRAETIYGGSHQIQRNIVGERALGLPPGTVTPPYPLDDVSVVDLSSGISGAYCSKLLADAGAEVVKVEPPGGDAFRDESALFAVLHTSKRNAILDPAVAEDRAVLDRLIAGADIVVTGHPRDAEEWLGADVDTLRRRVPQLVVVSVSWFGGSGPWSGRPATEFTLQAWCGSIASRGRKHEPPVATGGRIGEWVAGSVAGVATLAALHGVRRTGRGAHVDVSTFEAMTIAFNQFQAVAAQFDGRGPEPEVIARFVDVPSVEPTADGWVGFATNGSAQFRAFAEMVGHPEWADHPELGRVDRRGEHDRVLRAEIAAFTTAHTTDDVVRIASERRIPVAPLGNGETMPGFAPFVERAVFVEHPDGQMVQPRVPYRLGAGTTRPFGSVAPPGADTAALHAEPPRTRIASRDDGSDPARPLAGLRVFDFTSYWAGPYAAQILGFLGADVIKVESVQRPDGTRMGTAYSSVGDRPWELAPLFHGANTNKRDVTLDFTNPEGLALARRLLATCDVLIENYTPRVLERFGLLDDELRRSNPGLVVLRMPAWGLDGEWRDRPGFAQTMEQVTGLAWVTGHPEGAPIVPRGPCDPLGGLHATFAVLAALAHRARAGDGMTVEAPLVESALNVAVEQVAVFGVTGELLGRDGNRSRFAAPQNVYRVAGEDRWVALSVQTDEQWTALRSMLGEPGWSRDPRFETCAGRRAAHDTLDHELSIAFENADRDELARRLWDAGVPAAPVVNPRVVVDNEQHAARGFYEGVVHPVAGEARIPGFPAVWDLRTAPWHQRAAPLLGEHNAEVLGELGVDAAELERLTAADVTGDRPVG